MKISMVTPDIYSNCIGRAWLLQDNVKELEVEIVGRRLDRVFGSQFDPNSHTPVCAAGTPPDLSHRSMRCRKELKGM
jgi:hypothetical protein